MHANGFGNLAEEGCFVIMSLDPIKFEPNRDDVAGSQPIHLDRAACNERLYHHLVSQGYCVEPIYGAAKHAGIEYLRVSVSFSQQNYGQG